MLGRNRIDLRIGRSGFWRGGGSCRRCFRGRRREFLFRSRFGGRFVCKKTDGLCKGRFCCKRIDRSGFFISCPCHCNGAVLGRNDLCFPERRSSDNDLGSKCGIVELILGKSSAVSRRRNRIGFRDRGSRKDLSFWRELYCDLRSFGRFRLWYCLRFRRDVLIFDIRRRDGCFFIVEVIGCDSAFCDAADKILAFDVFGVILITSESRSAFECGIEYDIIIGRCVKVIS